MPLNIEPIVLASASASRQAMLKSAGVVFTALPAAIDERAAETKLAKNAAPEDLASSLAEMKARNVAPKAGGRIILAADQLLVCGGRIFHKPASAAEARAQLQSLRGKTHELLSAACLVRGEALLWRHLAGAKLTMRDFSDSFLDAYLKSCGDQVLMSVGVYQLEGPGAQLMARVEGDFFTILGLPLLDVLAALREHGALQA